jgi:hypothetical protein
MSTKTEYTCDICKMPIERADYNCLEINLYARPVQAQSEATIGHYHAHKRCAEKYNLYGYGNVTKQVDFNSLLDALVQEKVDAVVNPSR